jgi:hypothetical protein
MPNFHIHRITHAFHVLPHSSKACRARHVFDLLELNAHLHNAISNHPRVQTHRPSQGVLCLRTRIEAHNKVVADVMCGLQLFRRLGEEESAPVCDTANYPVLLEHDLAGGFGDSGVY